MITKTLWSSEHNEGAQNKRVRHALNTRPEHTGFAVNGGNGTRDATVWMAKLLPLPGWKGRGEFFLIEDTKVDVVRVVRARSQQLCTINR